MPIVPSPVEKPRKVWISAPVLAELTAECECFDPCETGGVLLGYWGEGMQEAVITYCVGPGFEAIHEPERFRPDQAYQLAEIAKLYEASGRRIQYLGDWHSHPSGGGGLSALDRRTLRRIALCRTARMKTPLMLVLAGEADWEPTVWIHEGVRRWCLSGWDVRELRLTVFEDRDKRQ